MGYSHNTYKIPFLNAAAQDNPNYDAVEQTALMMRSKNINLHEGGIRKRGGTAKDNNTVVTGTPQILGLTDFWVDTATQYKVFFASDGGIYKNYTTTIATGKSTTAKPSFSVFGNVLYMCNGVNVPMYWNGSDATVTVMTDIPATWATDIPFQFLSHGRGESRRLWAISPNYVWYSKLNDGTDFNDAASGYIRIDTFDGFGLTGAVEFGDRLIVFSKNQAFIIDDTDSDIANWGYQKVQWEGGVANFRCIVKTPNDVFCMMEDGSIYSVTAVQEYGDYKRADLTRPAYIDKWIRENIRLSYINDFHAVYDPILRAVKFFMMENNKTQIISCLVYFIDKPSNIAWTYHVGSTTSGYYASCSALVRSSTGNYIVMTGDYAGFVWKTEQTTRSDNGAGYYGGITTNHLSFDNPRKTKQYKRGILLLSPKGNYNLTVLVRVDDVQVLSTTVAQTGSGGQLDSFVLGTDVLGGTELIERSFDINAIGKRIRYEISNSGVANDFFLSQILTDFKLMGSRP